MCKMLGLDFADRTFSRIGGILPPQDLQRLSAARCRQYGH
jgi:hypothetical protein